MSSGCRGIALAFEAHGIGKLLLPLVRRQARKQLPENGHQLKEILERAQPSAARRHGTPVLTAPVRTVMPSLAACKPSSDAGGP